MFWSKRKGFFMPKFFFIFAPKGLTMDLDGLGPLGALHLKVLRGGQLGPLGAAQNQEKSSLGKTNRPRGMMIGASERQKEV